jgi:hypothetical protein
LKVKYLLILLLSVAMCPAHAQEVAFRDSITAYNKHRIKINYSGTRVLALWGVSNVAAGGIGYFAARRDEWKYFHGMNAAWGAINAGIAALSLRATRKQMAEPFNSKGYYERYRHDKKLYLINAGLDVLYIAGGAAMVEYSTHNKDNAAMLLGFGRSIAVQGVALLLFDNIMLNVHLRYNARWLRIMDELRLTNNGIGLSIAL